MASDFDDDDFGYDDETDGMTDAAQPIDPKVDREDDQKERKKPKAPKIAGPPIVFECLQFTALAATIVSIIFLVMLLDRYGWKLPS